MPSDPPSDRSPDPDVQEPQPRAVSPLGAGDLPPADRDSLVAIFGTLGDLVIALVEVVRARHHGDPGAEAFADAVIAEARHRFAELAAIARGELPPLTRDQVADRWDAFFAPMVPGAPSCELQVTHLADGGVTVALVDLADPARRAIELVASPTTAAGEFLASLELVAVSLTGAAAKPAHEDATS